MLTTARAFIILFTLAIATAFTIQNSSPSKEEFCRTMVIDNISKIDVELNASLEVANNATNKALPRQLLQQHYRLARKYYKEIEFFIEYYSPFEAKYYINGPLVPKLDLEVSNTPFEPLGFQVLEEILFDTATIDAEPLKLEIEGLREKFKFLKTHYSTIDIEANKLNEALKLQIVRMMCLTLNGYDCTINKESIIEAKYCLDGIRKVVMRSSSDASTEKIQRQTKAFLQMLQQANRVLDKHPNSDTFDRLDFIVRYLDPLFAALVKLGDLSGLQPSPIHYAVQLNSPSIFSTNGINKQHFSVYITDTVGNAAQADLGNLLFFDPILSGNNKRACASCHNEDKAFTDAQDKSMGYDGTTKISRNSPTLINAAYQKLFFHDGRVFNLEAQAGEVFNNAFEMNTSAVEIVEKLKQSDEYRLLFRNAFKGRPDTSITFYAVIKSITEFIKTLDSRNSRFDQYLRGNKHALNKHERNGFNVFAGKALCASCHFFPLFNGTVPPMFNDNEFEILGVPETENGRQIDPDPGREKISRSAIHKYAFKTPSLRNVELTAPYMHNGAYKSIDSVLVFYNKGGGAGLGIALQNQTLPFDSLGLTKRELNDLKLFLKTLTDVSSMPNKPSRLPFFKQSDLNNRRIGGEY